MAETRIVWRGERELRVRKALSILGPTSPRFDRDDMKAALDEIDRLRVALCELFDMVTDGDAPSIGDTPQVDLVSRAYANLANRVAYHGDELLDGVASPEWLAAERRTAPAGRGDTQKASAE